MTDSTQVVDVSADFVVEEDAPVAQAAVRRNGALGISGRPHDMDSKPAAKTQHSTAAANNATDDNEPLDKHKLMQRQKQVDFGKNTIGYQKYTQLIPKERRNKRDPSTPDIHQKVSKRCFDGQIKVWRRQLHLYDEGMPVRTQEPRRDARRTCDQDSVPADNQENDCPASPSSVGSLEGYFPPAAKKRGFGSAFNKGQEPVRSVGGAGAGGAAEPACIDREAKRSTASREGTHNTAVQTASTAGTAGHTLNTSFTGVAQRIHAREEKKEHAGGAEGAARKPTQAEKPINDNVLGLILGETNSCLSWADAVEDELDNVGL